MALHYVKDDHLSFLNDRLCLIYIIWIFLYVSFIRHEIYSEMAFLKFTSCRSGSWVCCQNIITGFPIFRCCASENIPINLMGAAQRNCPLSYKCCQNLFSIGWNATQMENIFLKWLVKLAKFTVFSLCTL